MTTEFIGTEHLPPEGFVEPHRRFKITYRCSECDHEFSRTYRVIPKKDPPCPNKTCEIELKLRQAEIENARMTQMLADRTGPAHIGGNTQVRAIDATADIVMTDYKMTDLKDRVEPGEGMAPKLDPGKQAAADNYFGGQGLGRAAPSEQVATDFATGQRRTIDPRVMERIGRRAIAGGFRSMAVPPNAVTPDAVRGQPGLTKVRDEPLQRPAKNA